VHSFCAGSELVFQLCSVAVQDNVVRVWMMDSDNNIVCIAAGYGHTHTVMSVAFFR